MNATHVGSVLALDPERTLLLSTVGPSAIELRRTIIVAQVIIDTMISPKMLSEVIFSGKRTGACVPIAMRTWELGGLVAMTLENIKASICIAAFAFEGIVVGGFGVARQICG